MKSQFEIQAFEGTNKLSFRQHNNPGYGGSYVDRLTIGSSGNVGIGTASPESHLHIEGTDDLSLSTHGLAVLGVISGDNIVIDGNEIQARNNGDFDTLFINKEGGNVGIGVSSTNAELHVNGEMILEKTGNSPDFYMIGKNSSGVKESYFSLYARNTSNTFAISQNDNPSGSGTWRDRFVIDSNGRIGFGTEDPKTKLHVLATTDVSLSDDSGIFLIGQEDSYNIAMDRDEIMARNDGATSTLYLQANGGKVGIAKGSGVSYTLDVGGSVRGTSAFDSSSDERFKKEIKTIEDALKTILSLRGVKFEWRTEEFPHKNFSVKKDIGVIAQEVEKHLPEVVTTDAEGYKSVAYAKLTPLLVEAVKGLHHQVEALSAEQRALREREIAREEQMKSLIKWVKGLERKETGRELKSISY